MRIAIIVNRRRKATNAAEDVGNGNPVHCWGVRGSYCGELYGVP